MSRNNSAKNSQWRNDFKLRVDYENEMAGLLHGQQMIMAAGQAVLSQLEKAAAPYPPDKRHSQWLGKLSLPTTVNIAAESKYYTVIEGDPDSGIGEEMIALRHVRTYNGLKRPILGDRKLSPSTDPDFEHKMILMRFSLQAGFYDEPIRFPGLSIALSNNAVDRTSTALFTDGLIELASVAGVKLPPVNDLEPLR
jgi:hypothetical protein